MFKFYLFQNIGKYSKFNKISNEILKLGKKNTSNIKDKIPFDLILNLNKLII